MRANSPVDDFQLFNPPDDTPKPVSAEQVELAKIGKSADWSMIKNYLQARVETYKTGLFGEELTGMDAATIGNRTLAAKAVIQEFEALIDEVDRTTKVVEEAAHESNPAS